LLTGIVFGLAPALESSRPDLVPALKDETALLDQKSRRLSLRNTLVIAQVALSLVLLVGAGLFLRSLWEMRSVSVGFDSEKLLSAPLNINLLRYTSARGREFYRQVIERAEELPGVESATVARIVPLSGGGSVRSLLIEGQAGTNNDFRSEGAGLFNDSPNTIAVNTVGPNYFQTLGIALLRGRDFSSKDAPNAPAVVIASEAFVKRHFADQEPLGKRLSLRGERGPWLEIVGVVKDSKYQTVSEAPTPFLYLPVAQNHETGMTLLVRSSGNPASIASAIRGEIQSLEKNLPVTGIRPMTELINGSLYAPRMGAILIAIFGAIALVLASFGLYGVMSFSVSRRTREIGVRVALGAERRDVLSLVMKEGLLLVGTGMALGISAAVAATRLLESFLYGVSTVDALTFAGVAVILALVALVACYIPARRATKVDPIVALRYE
jgi:putative ABC transport system permease protein